ncbi:MAG: sulfatase [Elusimicrobia bacterium RIFOXYA2_FULL_40_6]|nr:MAG: sulfatase [Elusimicrobia bacterium RIFOXYA2_FULL_40_6]
MPNKKPNILLITSDQQHWNTLGCLNKEVKTPNLDKLAKQGVVFTRAYCSNPTCTPARASIITGKYPSQHGAWALGTKLSETEHTVGEDFSKAGYKTALVGKAHFQPTKSTKEFTSLESEPIVHNKKFWKEFHGPFYGFDRVELARNHADESIVGQHYVNWMEKNGCKNWKDYFLSPAGKVKNQKHKWLIPEQYHYDNWIASQTNSLMEEYNKKGENFFLWASFFDPHTKYLVPEPWDTMYDPDKITVPSVFRGEHANNPPHFKLTQQRNPDFSKWKESGKTMHGFYPHSVEKKVLAKDIAVYYAMVSLMDKYIGKILDRLEELNLAKNTIVVFTSDHGHFFGQHGLTTKGPFHYEDMIKIPFIARYPGHIPAGKRSCAMQSLVDLAPTFLKYSGLDIPREMTGVDQSAVWSGRKNQARNHVIVENHHEPTTIHLKTYADKRYKITTYFNQKYGEMFDLKKDPKELNNLWNNKKHARLKTELLMKLISAEMGKEPMWMPRIAGA